MKVSEPSVAYNASNLQGLKNRLIASIDGSNDEEKLQQCLELLHADSMPCVFSDEDFKLEVKASEMEGIATPEEVADMFAEWNR